MSEARSSRFILLSRPLVVAISLGLVLLTGLLVAFLATVNPDRWFADAELAIKVGGTKISLPEFARLKALSGPKAAEIANSAFAAELQETLLLAEGARSLGLDREPGFLEQVARFDKAPPEASGSADLARALFLLEELAKRMRLRILADLPPLASASVAAPAPAVDPNRLHLQTLLARTASEAADILTQATRGVSFAELNKQYPHSLYAPVGGDLGWKSPADFPPGTDARLQSTPVGSLSIGFSDPEGVHLFLVVARPQQSASLSARLARGRQRLHQEQEAIRQYLATARRRLGLYLHPALSGAMTEASPATGETRPEPSTDP